jgi:serine-type D-Ala-D-Ala carboxypeptidase/endopeptidase
MENIVEPKEDQVKNLVTPYLKAQPSGLGFAIGCASPTFTNSGRLYFVGNIQNQFGSPLIGAATLFEIASITKTFTSTLYALLIRASHPRRTIGDYGLPISSTLANITLDQLANYTSGLPQDNDIAGAEVATPPFWPRSYSMAQMMSFLDAAPPPVLPPGKAFTYSNLAFDILSTIIASDGTNGNPTIGAFVSKTRKHIFKPLKLQAKFFDEVSLADLPLGFHYEYLPSPTYTAMAPGDPLFPAIFGDAGIVATPNDMFKWLLFNMGITQDKHLTPLLPALQTRSTRVTEPEYGNHLGLGWFIHPADADCSGSIFKSGRLDGFSSYIAFLPSAEPGAIPSQAGAFVLVNADGITHTQTRDGQEIAFVLTNDLLCIMQGKKPPADKSVYPRSVQKGSQRRPPDRLSRQRP